jgi:NADPH-dependent ferric siderophore reductase
MAVAESSRKLEPTLRTLVDEIVEHYNESYPGAVLFVAQSLAQNESIQRAQIADVESNTIVFDIGGGERYRYEFAEPIAAGDDMATRFLGTLHACRRKSPDGELTALEKDMARTSALPTTPLTVTASVQLTPCIREITFTGDLTNIEYPGWDAFLFFFVPKTGERLPDGFSMAAWRSMKEAEKPGGAYYTIRSFGETELVCWFVVHDVFGAVSDWAGRSQPGDEVYAWGPRVAFAPKGADTHYLLLADETALGAVAAVMDQLPATATVTLIAEVSDETSRVNVRCEPHWGVHWLYRHDTAPGSSEAPIEFAKSMRRPSGDDVYVYAAMEAEQTQKLKKVFKQEWGLSGHQIRCIGYWRLHK